MARAPAGRRCSENEGSSAAGRVRTRQCPVRARPTRPEPILPPGARSEYQDGMVDVRQPGFTDGDEIALLGNRLDVPRFSAHAERRNTEIAPLPDLPGCERIDEFSRKLREQLRAG